MRIAFGQTGNSNFRHGSLIREGLADLMTTKQQNDESAPFEETRKKKKVTISDESNDIVPVTCHLRGEPKEEEESEIQS